MLDHLLLNQTVPAVQEDYKGGAEKKLCRSGLTKISSGARFFEKKTTERISKKMTIDDETFS